MTSYGIAFASTSDRLPKKMSTSEYKEYEIEDWKSTSEERFPDHENTDRDTTCIDCTLGHAHAACKGWEFIERSPSVGSVTITVGCSPPAGAEVGPVFPSNNETSLCQVPSQTVTDDLMTLTRRSDDTLPLFGAEVRF